MHQASLPLCGRLPRSRPQFRKRTFSRFRLK
jgi:hypothetical protein